MYAPIATSTLTSNDPAVAITKPAAIGNKQLVYLIITAPSADCQLAKAGDTSAAGFTVAAGETWMAGPIFGEDIEEWGLFSAAEETDQSVRFIAGNPLVDVSGRGVYDRDDAVQLAALDFVWKQVA